MNRKYVIGIVTTIVLIVLIVLVSTMLGGSIENENKLTNSTDVTINSNKLGKEHSNNTILTAVQTVKIKPSNGKGNILPSDGHCGKQEYQDRIINGHKLGLAEHPWLVLLDYEFPDGSTDYQCGGVIINQRYVLTAAHCLAPKQSVGFKLIAVRIGEHDVITDPDCITLENNEKECAPPAIDIGIEEILVHPEYKSQQHFDIGLIRLAEDIKFTDEYVQPICLPNLSYKVHDGDSLLVAGWGNTDAKEGNPSAVKLGVFIPLFNFEKCRQTFGAAQIEITESVLCAGGEKGKDSCQNDSGGPLMISINGTWHVEGVVSFGHSCGLEGWPGLYANVRYLDKWIRDSLRP